MLYRAALSTGLPGHILWQAAWMAGLNLVARHGQLVGRPGTGYGLAQPAKLVEEAGRYNMGQAAACYRPAVPGLARWGQASRRGSAVQHQDQSLTKYLKILSS